MLGATRVQYLSHLLVASFPNHPSVTPNASFNDNTRASIPWFRASVAISAWLDFMAVLQLNPVVTPRGGPKNEAPGRSSG
jgi:hypothetical protein